MPQDARFNSPRNKALDIALSVRERLQDALNSAKHGSSSARSSGSQLSIRSLLHSNVSDTKTITIHHDSTKYMVLFRWYSMCTIRLKDIFLSISVATEVTIHLDKTRMEMYVISIPDVVSGIASNNRDILVCNHGSEDSGEYYIRLSNCPPDVLNRIVRKTSFNCCDSEWEVTGEQGDIITTFDGNKFSNVMMYADVTLSTDVDITVSYMGKVNATILYSKYVTDDNSDLYIANMLCTRSKGNNTYRTIACDEPVKRMSIRSQVETLIESSLNNYTDGLVSMESRLMVGVDVSMIGESDN